MSDVLITSHVAQPERTDLICREGQKAQRDYRGVDEQRLCEWAVCLLPESGVRVLVSTDLVGGHKEHGYANQARDSGVDARPEQKCNEVLYVSVSDASANPWAMMVVNFNAHSTLTAVERPRRPQMLARIAVAHLVVPLPRLDVAIRIHVHSAVDVGVLAHVHPRQVLELVQAVVLINRVGDVYLIHGMI